MHLAVPSGKLPVPRPGTVSLGKTGKLGICKKDFKEAGWEPETLNDTVLSPDCIAKCHSCNDDNDDGKKCLRAKLLLVS
jgi:hypothetical protein